MSKSRILNVTNMSFNAIRENKILAKISELTLGHSHKVDGSFEHQNIC